MRIEQAAARIQPLRMDLYSLRREDLAAAVRILVSPVRCEQRWRCIWRRREHEAEVLSHLLALHGSDTSAAAPSGHPPLPFHRDAAAIAPSLANAMRQWQRPILEQPAAPVRISATGDNDDARPYPARPRSNDARLCESGGGGNASRLGLQDGQSHLCSKQVAIMGQHELIASTSHRAPPFCILTCQRSGQTGSVSVSGGLSYDHIFYGLRTRCIYKVNNGRFIN
ncbi:unnamed protein product [Urochloa humidicola]